MAKQIYNMGHSTEQITWNFQQVKTFLQKQLLNFFKLRQSYATCDLEKLLVHTEPVTKSMFVITEVGCYFYPCFVNT